MDEPLPANGWVITGNDTLHLTWRHADTPHAFWTDSCNVATPTLPFSLPLDLLFHDIVQMGGGIVHGGLAVYRGRGVLLTAPPGRRQDHGLLHHPGQLAAHVGRRRPGLAR